MKPIVRRSALIFALGIGVLVLSQPGASLGNAPPAPPNLHPIEPSDADRVERGAGAFRVFCSSCHGRSAEGDGPMAEYLRIPPSNLTTLAGRHGGVFPEDEVYSAVDGRRSVRGDGPREMPVWGYGFQIPGRDSDQEEEVRQRILDLAAFLKSIQK